MIGAMCFQLSQACSSGLPVCQVVPASGCYPYAMLSDHTLRADKLCPDTGQATAGLPAPI